MRCEFILLFFLVVTGAVVVLYELRARANNQALSTPATPAAPVEPVAATCSKCGSELTYADDLGYSAQFDQGEVLHGSDGLCAYCRVYNPD